MKQKAVLVDIDNCYMDSRELIANHNGDWNWFAKNLSALAVPNTSFIEGLLELIKEGNLVPIFTTGREDKDDVLNVSIKQIEEGSNGTLVVGRNCFILLRENGDFRKAVFVKKEMLDTIRTHYDPVAAIDDEMSICQMYAENGIPKVFCYHIGDDEFQEVTA